MPNRRDAVALLTGTTATLVAPLPAPAHHGLTERSDDVGPIYFEGVVRSANFCRPHPIVEMQVDADLRAPRRCSQARSSLISSKCVKSTEAASSKWSIPRLGCFST